MILHLVLSTLPIAPAGLASAVALADWDHDGDLDLIIGNIDGEVRWMSNETPRGAKITAPVFGPAKRMLVQGKPLSVGSDAGPRVADWNGDGVPDLLVGAAGGSVRMYPATYSRGDTEFGLPVVLVPAVEGNPYSNVKIEMDPETHKLAPLLARSHMRAEPFVVDWDGDGRPDLLVGDFSQGTGTSSKLTPLEERELEDLQERYDETVKRAGPIYLRAQAAAERKLGYGIGSVTRDPERLKHFNDESQAFLAIDPEHIALQEEQQKIWPRLSKLKPDPLTFGHVWVYLQK